MTTASSVFPDLGPAPGIIRAPRGAERTCRTWQAEAAMRMLMNNLDPEVAERPRRPRRLRRSRPSRPLAGKPTTFHAIASGARSAWHADETLLVQSGKPVGIVTHPRPTPPASSSPTPTSSPTGPRKNTSTNSARKGLMMYGQMTAGSWIYIGTQGILQGHIREPSQNVRAECTLTATLCRHPLSHRRLRRNGRRTTPRRHPRTAALV